VQYTDWKSKLQYLQARYYDPNTEQFLTVDPIADQSGEPYGCGGDNPVDAAEPGGVCAAQSYRDNQGPALFKSGRGTKGCQIILRGIEGKGDPHNNLEVQPHGGGVKPPFTDYQDWYV
jgi:RHS repeat-associated protein